ncbi:MAG: VOC family protein [Chitinispirillales bacterium]|jgi:lactoylglutathione lyase/glyoxylase I family protein|nr:VOC family protein [Chitinispirillales bacterium]
MDSGKRHDDEADIFDLADAQSRPVSSTEHIETETNVFFVDTLRNAALRGGTDSGTFEVSTSANAAPEASPSGAGADADASGDFEPPTPKGPAIDADDDPLDPLDDIDDPLDDDLPPKKGGFFAKLFGRGARNDEVDDDLDDLSPDDDMFIAPPPASERTAASKPPAATDSGVFEKEPAAVSTVPEVTDSGVFEFKTSTDNDASAANDEPAEAATVPEVTDSGVFEFKTSTDNDVSAANDEPAEAATVPEVTDSGVFDMKNDEPEPAAHVPEVTDSGIFDMKNDEPEPAAHVPEVTDSGIFDMKNDEPEPAAHVPEVTDSGIFEMKDDEPAPAAAVPEVTDSGVFELQPASDAPSDPHGGQKGGEWEIGWEPEDDGGASAEFDVAGSGGAQTAAATETPPPVFTKLAHVCIYVKDLGRSVDFYSKLGFQKRFVFNRNGSLFGAYLEFGDGNFIELFEDVSRSAVAALGRLAHFCLETPDIDATMESLSARGIGFSPKKLGSDSTYQIWLKDPDGNEFEIHQYTENSSQIVGGEVEADW